MLESVILILVGVSQKVFLSVKTYNLLKMRSMDRFMSQIHKVINKLFKDIINGVKKETKFMDGRDNE
jgi:hypothetical protein